MVTRFGGGLISKKSNEWGLIYLTIHVSSPDLHFKNPALVVRQRTLKPFPVGLSRGGKIGLGKPLAKPMPLHEISALTVAERKKREQTVRKGCNLQGQR